MNCPDGGANAGPRELVPKVNGPEDGGGADTGAGAGNGVAGGLGSGESGSGCDSSIGPLADMFIEIGGGFFLGSCFFFCGCLSAISSLLCLM